MSMSDFIEADREGILEDWARHAERLRPRAEGLSRAELRDLAEAILMAVTADMRSRRTEDERHSRSLGVETEGEPGALLETAHGHAAERLTQGFTLNDLVSEYRALRASILRRWRTQVAEFGEEELEEVMRFNEAIDESLTEAVDWYNSRLQDARDLLNGVLAHDLRSPLAAGLTSIDVLLLDDSLSATQMKTVVRVRNGLARMSTMIADLLDFTRTRLGTGLPIALAAANLGMIVRDVCEEQRAAHPHATIRRHVSGEVTGHWDAARLAQMLSNLIGNAVNHGQQSPVRVEAEGRDEEVLLRIHNARGVIPEDQQRIIFDPLRRASLGGRERRPDGTGIGLGLYIARQIAEAHDGTIDVESSDDQGTTFTVRLPRRPRPGAEGAGLT